MSWTFPPGTDRHLTGAVPEASAGGVAGSDSVLARVNINTPSSSATLAVYKGPFGTNPTPSTTGTKIAQIDCSSNARTIDYMVRCSGGVYAVLTPAATGADVSIVII